MADITVLADEVMNKLELGDHLYPDVRDVLEGKLRDRVDKLLLGLKDNALDARKAKMLNNLHRAMSGLLKPHRRIETRQGFRNVPLSGMTAFKMMKENADYYRKKYPSASTS